MRFAQYAYGFSDTDRLGLALFVSILVHMVVILGVSFGAARIRMPGAESLEITLVQTRSDKAPRNPQFLAQANQDGGGDADTRAVASNPLPVMEMSDRNDRVPLAQPAPQRRVTPVDELIAYLTRADDDRAIRSREPQPQRHDERLAPERMGLPPRNALEAERARLNAEIDRNWQQLQKAPRQKYINARTQEYKYTMYMEQWRAKVERVGELSVPAQVTQQNISGSLVLDVAINPDGSVHGVQILTPSKYQILNDTAVRIVQRAAPYAPLPPDIRAETDILHITRTWRFRESTVVTE